MQDYWHWRNTMKPARFFMFDARAALPVAVCLIHFRTWTLVTTAVVMLIFWLLERRGLTFDAALRAARLFIVGRTRPALIWSAMRRMIDARR